MRNEIKQQHHQARRRRIQFAQMNFNIKSFKIINFQIRVIPTVGTTFQHGEQRHNHTIRHRITSISW